MQLNFPSYTAAYAVTKSDTALNPGRALYVGGTGNVALTLADKGGVLGSGSSVTFQAVPVGTILPIEFAQVLSTGTTATLMVALS